MKTWTSINELTLNPVTGYRESSNSSATFNSERKQKFIELARQVIENGHEYPNIGDLCKIMDISVRTFENHLKLDAKVNDEWKELELKGEATCLTDMYSLRKKNPMYMFGWLRARFPEKYNPSVRVENNNDSSTIKRLSELFNQRITVTDAEIVPPAPTITSTQNNSSSNQSVLKMQTVDNCSTVDDDVV